MARRSPPAQKARPGTASIKTALTPGSLGHSRNCPKSEAHIAWVRALSALGRFSVMWPRAPSRRGRTSPIEVIGLILRLLLRPGTHYCSDIIGASRMRTVGAREANQQFSRLLREAEEGHD